MKKMLAKQLPAAMILCGLFVFALPATDIVPFTDITPAQAAAMIKAKSADPLFMILDVRTAGEFAESWIKGAMNIDVKATDFTDRIDKLDKNGVYLAYCKGGIRSAKAMNLMKEWGFKEVYNLGGGLMKWRAEKLPLETAANFREEKEREREE
jgi:rhodanese-related sulfurtransferase